MAATILVGLFSALTNWQAFPTLYFIFKLYFCKKVIFSAMPPVNNRNTSSGVKGKHKSLSITEKVELLKKLNSGVSVNYMALGLRLFII